MTAGASARQSSKKRQTEQPVESEDEYVDAGMSYFEAKTKARKGAKADFSSVLQLVHPHLSNYKALFRVRCLTACTDEYSPR
jgi:hypothetical protein